MYLGCREFVSSSDHAPQTLLTQYLEKCWTFSPNSALVHSGARMNSSCFGIKRSKFKFTVG